MRERKAISVLLGLAMMLGLCAGLLTPKNTMASDGVGGEDFTYTINEGEVTITGYIGSETVVVVPKFIEDCPVTSIENRAFKDSGIVDMSLPEGLRSIGQEAFRGCSSLVGINLPSTLSTIGIYAFRDCTGLTRMTIPQGVTSIGSHTFRYCSALEAIRIPDSVTSIGSNAFEGCTSLKEVDIPESVKKIDVRAFYGCTALERIRIPEGNTIIYNESFTNCTSLVEVIVPASVKEIRYEAFKNCLALTAVFFGDAPTLGSNVFSISNNINIQYLYGTRGYTDEWSSRKKQPFYLVTYQGNGNTSGTAPVDGGTYLEGNTVTLKNQGDLQKEDYVFTGWNTHAHGSGTSYHPEEIYDIGTDHVTFYAQWTPIITHPRAQLKLEVPQSPDDPQSAILRFISGLDSLENKREVGFVVSLQHPIPAIGDSGSVTCSTKTVYGFIFADGESIPASQFGGKYIVALTLVGVPQEAFSRDIYVRPFVRLMDETINYGESRSFKVEDLVHP